MRLDMRTMLKTRKLTSFGIVAIVASAAVGGTAIARNDQPTPAQARAALPAKKALDADVAASFSAFRSTESASTERLSGTQAVVLSSIQQSVGQLPPESIAAKIDWSRAVGQQSLASGSIWIAPAGKGICTIIADAGGGDGSVACNTLKEARDGNAITIRQINGMASDQLIVAAPIADGASAPKLRGPSRASASLKVAENLGVGVAKVGDSVTYGQETLDLTNYNKVPEGQPAPTP